MVLKVVPTGELFTGMRATFALIPHLFLLRRGQGNSMIPELMINLQKTP